MKTRIIVKLPYGWHYSHDTEIPIKFGDEIESPLYYIGKVIMISHDPEIAYVQKEDIS